MISEEEDYDQELHDNTQEIDEKIVENKRQDTSHGEQENKARTIEGQRREAEQYVDPVEVQRIGEPRGPQMDVRGRGHPESLVPKVIGFIVQEQHQRAQEGEGARPCDL